MEPVVLLDAAGRLRVQRAQSLPAVDKLLVDEGAELGSCPWRDLVAASGETQWPRTGSFPLAAVGVLACRVPTAGPMTNAPPRQRRGRHFVAGRSALENVSAEAGDQATQSADYRSRQRQLGR